MKEYLQKQIAINATHHNQRIDSVLAELLPEYSRSQISLWIKQGDITLNQKPCKPKDKVLTGSQIHININFIKDSNNFNLCEPEAIPLDIIFEDEEVLVINKPAGLIVHPGAGNKEHTLVNALLHHEPRLSHLPRAGIIHRLDKDTTGLLVIAKSQTAHTSLIRQMQARQIQRLYVALVQGVILSGGTIDTFFGRHPRNRLKMAVTEQGRQAITHYKIKKSYPDFTLLDVQLMTGRTHQIRVHLAYINHPIIGDQLYSKHKALPAKLDTTVRNHLLQFQRQALHASSLSFKHPQKDEELLFTCTLPTDFQSVLNLLDNYYDK